MGSKMACVFAALLHLLLEAVSKDQCSTAPKLGSHLFLLAILLCLRHQQVIPRCLMRIAAPRIFLWLLELLITIWVQLWLMEVLWCGWVRCIHRIARIFCQNCPWCEYGVEQLFSLLLALTTLYVVIEFVCPAKVKARVERTVVRALNLLHIDQGSGSFVERIKDVRTYVRGAILFFRLTREQRMLSIRVFEVQVERRMRGYVEPKQLKPDKHQDIAVESESQEEPVAAEIESQEAPGVEMQPLESKELEEAAGIGESSV